MKEMESRMRLSLRLICRPTIWTGRKMMKTVQAKMKMSPPPSRIRATMQTTSCVMF